MSKTQFAAALADIRERLRDPLGDYDDVRETALAFMEVEIDKLEAVYSELDAECDDLRGNIEAMLYLSRKQSQLYTALEAAHAEVVAERDHYLRVLDLLRWAGQVTEALAASEEPQEAENEIGTD